MVGHSPIPSLDIFSVFVLHLWTEGNFYASRHEGFVIGLLCFDQPNPRRAARQCLWQLLGDARDWRMSPSQPARAIHRTVLPSQRFMRSAEHARSIKTQSY